LPTNITLLLANSYTQKTFYSILRENGLFLKQVFRSFGAGILYEFTTIKLLIMQSIKEIFKVGFGPSSSHTIGPTIASEMFLKKYPQATRINAHLYGSLASTGKGHYTDKAIEKIMEKKDVEILWKPDEELPKHPNGLLFEAFDGDTKLGEWKVYSVGGGDLDDDSGMLAKKTQIYDMSTMTEILDWCKREGRNFWEYVELSEGPEIWDFLGGIWKVMKQSIKKGLDNEGVLPGPLKVPRKAADYYTRAINAKKGIKDKGLVFSYALAVSEQNASGGKLVTAPTCGASGVLPATLYHAQKNQGHTDARILRALAIAGLIGNITKTNGSISGAEVGCQGEIGTACAMSAGAVAYLIGGTPAQIEYAAEMGFEHNLGLTCDPIAGYVQIPCIERNAFAADKARESAVYAIFSDGAHKIPFDQVVQTMMETGKDMQSKYRETGKGGLARTWKPFSV